MSHILSTSYIISLYIQYYIRALFILRAYLLSIFHAVPSLDDIFQKLHSIFLFQQGNVYKFALWLKLYDVLPIFTFSAYYQRNKIVFKLLSRLCFTHLPSFNSDVFLFSLFFHRLCRSQLFPFCQFVLLFLILSFFVFHLSAMLICNSNGIDSIDHCANVSVIFLLIGLC